MLSSLTLVCATLAVEPGAWRTMIQPDSFAGWHSPSGHTDLAGAWKIENGVLTVKPFVQHRTDLWSDEEYGEFELEWEWRAAKAANSGVKYWVQRAVTLVVVKEDEKWKRVADPREAAPGEITIEYTTGLEYQMADDAHEPDSLKRANSRAGGVYNFFAPRVEVAQPHGQWNSSRLVVRRGRVEHWLNGQQTASFTPEELQAELKGSKAGLKFDRKRTPIALQYHQTEVSFRRMRIRRLD